MSFGKHHIDPAQTEAMRSAFHKLCDALMLRCDGDDPMTEFIVTKIVALAKAGEHDANRLVELVLNAWQMTAFPPLRSDERPAVVRGPEIQFLTIRALEHQNSARFGDTR
jgi:hypothetical protein